MSEVSQLRRPRGASKGMCLMNFPVVEADRSAFADAAFLSRMSMAQYIELLIAFHMDEDETLPTFDEAPLELPAGESPVNMQARIPTGYRDALVDAAKRSGLRSGQYFLRLVTPSRAADGSFPVFAPPGELPIDEPVKPLERPTLVQVKAALPTELGEALVKAAQRSRLSESRYLELVLSTALADGQLPTFEQPSKPRKSRKEAASMARAS